MNLHEVLDARRDEVMQRWQALVAGTITPEAMNPAELLDHLPRYLKEIASALREDAGLAARGVVAGESVTAAGHGEQRLRLGFSLDAVVREYGALRDAVVATARDVGAEITFRELQVLSDAIISGIAHAVTEYTQQRDAELRRLANEHFGFIAHELRNPLHSASMAFQLLKAKGQLPTEGSTVRSLERGIRLTSELVDQSLKVARAASGIDVRKEATTLQALVADAELGSAAEAEAKGVELRLTVERDERIVVDTRLVASALGNLVRNGVKYSRAGGAVAVRGRVADGRVTIEVEDTCGGLPPGKVEEAFAPFVRLDQRQSGFGLGLAIAKQAVDAHGGTIRVQNLPDKGCIFVMELPAS